MTQDAQFIRICRWTGRTIGALIFLLVGVPAIGEVLPNPLHQSLTVNLCFLALLVMLTGQIVAWRHEGIGALAILGGFAGFCLVNRGIRLNVVFAPILATGLIYLLCFCGRFWTRRATGSTLPPESVRPPLSWGRALALAVGAVYGPQLLMGLITLGVVDCDHCRATVWKLMAIAPGVEIAMTPLLVSRHALSPLGDIAKLVIVTVLSLSVLAGLTALLRCSGRWRWLLFSVAVLLFSAGAFLLLAMIRA